MGLFSGRAARRPDANSAAVPLLLQDLRENALLQHLEYLTVPEEGRYVDEDVLEESLRLGQILSEQAHVLGKRCQPVQGHAASQPPPDAVELVFAEIDPDRAAEKGENVLELGVIRRAPEHLCL